jgi:DNA-binding transcriptional regulator YiaG
MSTTITRRALVIAADRRRCQTPLPSPSERRNIREASLLTRDEVALAVGCSTRAIYRWESGDREPRGLYATRYGNVLDLLARDLARQATKAMSSEVRIAS